MTYLRSGAPVDVVISDYAMGQEHLNGLQLLEEVRTANAGTRRILMSGELSFPGLTAALKDGLIDLFVQKGDAQGMSSLASWLEHPPERTQVTRLDSAEAAG